MKKIVFLTGAGMSAESGISTYRDSGGLWENYPVQDVASIDGYYRDPKLVLKFHNMLRAKLKNAQPNEGHWLVASLESKYNVTVVTQNVDDLHERAGSTNIIHLHGEVMKATSSNDPNNPRCIVTLTEENMNIEIGDKAKDGSQLRPYIVWFGESVPMIEPAIEELRTADILVVVGTSLNVYPAASLIYYVQEDCRIYLIDPKDVNVSPTLNVTHIMKGASEGMKELCELLAKE